MALSCGSKVLKYLIFFTNAVLCISSLFFLIVAIRGLATKYIPAGFPDLPHEIEINRTGLIMLAVFSAFSFFISFLGCYGALNERRGMLMTYALIMFLFIVLIIAAQITVASSYGRVESAVDDAMTDLFKNVTKTADKEKIDEFKTVEVNFHCCGPSQELQADWIKLGGCANGTSTWTEMPPCSKVVTKGLGVGGLVVTLILLFASIIAMGAACCLRSAVTDRGSYTEFS